MLIKSRVLSLVELLEKKSFFLFGPRATGKSYLIRYELADRAVVIDLLRQDNLLRLSAEPFRLESMVMPLLKSKSVPWVVIDEVQKVPALLDEVHRLIEAHRWTFLLTASSTRKLKRGHANLLGGRARTASLLPLTWSELEDFNLEHYLRFGGLPMVINSEEPEEDLDAYVQTYLKEEIQAEGFIKKLPPFARFLQTAALSNGQLINFAGIASDAGVPAATVREYYFLLQDTLLGTLLPPWTKSIKRKAIETAKFFFFDTGVSHALAGTKHIDRNSNLYGISFEHFIGMELRAYIAYRRVKEQLCYWRSTAGHEVDFVVGDEIAIEVKAGRKTSERDLNGIQALAEEKKIKNFYLVSHDETHWSTQIGTQKVKCVHWEAFLRDLWHGDII